MSLFINDYKIYHKKSMDIGDVDPSYPLLRYVCDRFELNIEQRFWLAFLYATSYCGPTAFYMYNEFPDYENIDINRMEKWWQNSRDSLYFQTDKRWIRSRNLWVKVCESYKSKVGNSSQYDLFTKFKKETQTDTYEEAWKQMSGLYQFGRFAMFLYLESVHVLTDFDLKPKTMIMKDADSCRNGLAFALNRKDLIGKSSDITKEDHSYLQLQFDKLVCEMESDESRNNVWNIETTLCAYKKYRLGKRWIGYYLDRQHDEISKMEASVKNGVDWSVLWDYRKENIQKEFLKEMR